MQREEKQFDAAIDAILQQVQDLKNSISSLLMKLEHGYETLNWPTVLDSFALLSGQINTLNKLLRNEKTPQFRNCVLLPLLLAPEPDPDLGKLTEGRVITFNHEVVPDYLRTKPEPEIEEKLQGFINRANVASTDNLQKQINALNRISGNMIDMINSNREEWESDMNQKTQTPQTSSQTDTTSLIAATSFGKGLKQLRRPDSGPPPAPGSSTTPTPEPSRASPVPAVNVQVTKAPSSIKTSIKSASNVHPYTRP